LEIREPAKLNVAIFGCIRPGMIIAAWEIRWDIVGIVLIVFYVVLSLENFDEKFENSQKLINFFITLGKGHLSGKFECFLIPGHVILSVFKKSHNF
jgi:hypothetical protein